MADIRFVSKADNQDICPACGSDLDGGAIPEADRKHYDPPYRWSRIIAVEMQGQDYISSWKCPDCGYEAASRKAFCAEVKQRG